MNSKKVLLIGGAGFIGHNLAATLKGQGHDVSVIDSLFINNLLTFYSHYNKTDNKKLYINIINERLKLLEDLDIPLYVQDARDYHALTKIIDELHPQVIVHLAAVSHADRSNKDPYSTFDHSFRTLENALDASKKFLEHFIYFSSSMVYGNFKENIVSEETVCEPLGIYGALKFSGEKIVIAYNQVFDLPYTIIRPSALYGERCISRRVLQIFLEKLFQNQPISISGEGEDSLDFTYVDDLSDGISKVISNKNSINQTFNMTYGKARSLKEAVTVLSEYFPNIQLIYTPKDKLVPKRGTLSIQKAKDLVGYNPAYDIERGLKKYIDWYSTII